MKLKKEIYSSGLISADTARAASEDGFLKHLSTQVHYVNEKIFKACDRGLYYCKIRDEHESLEVTIFQCLEENGFEVKVDSLGLDTVEYTIKWYDESVEKRFKELYADKN